MFGSNFERMTFENEVSFTETRSTLTKDFPLKNLAQQQPTRTVEELDMPIKFNR